MQKQDKQGLIPLHQMDRIIVLPQTYQQMNDHGIVECFRGLAAADAHVNEHNKAVFIKQDIWRHPLSSLYLEFRTEIQTPKRRTVWAPPLIWLLFDYGNGHGNGHVMGNIYAYVFRKRYDAERYVQVVAASGNLHTPLSTRPRAFYFYQEL